MQSLSGRWTPPGAELRSFAPSYASRAGPYFLGHSGDRTRGTPRRRSGGCRRGGAHAALLDRAGRPLSRSAGCTTALRLTCARAERARDTDAP